MFTGIITDIGRVVAIEASGAGDPLVVVSTTYDVTGIALGASIMHSGICLTVIDRSGTNLGGGRFTVQLSPETLAVTTARHWRSGTEINLERALRIGDELGGHIVTGHVDGVGRVTAAQRDGLSLRLTIEAPAELERLVARKGSIAVDGVSLTVNDVEGARFEVNIIPHTQRATTLGAASPGTEVNLEVDLLARYVARLLDEARS